MGILVGMDEAGYGPNLGPLVVAATVWHLPDDRLQPRALPASDTATGERDNAYSTLMQAPVVSATRLVTETDLYRLLRNIVAKSPSERRIAIADSKVLYTSGQGLRQLERGVHAVLHTIGQPLGCWSAMVEHCRADPESEHSRYCWPDGFDCRLPLDANVDELARLGTRFARACSAADIRPLAIRARLVFPAELNALVRHFGSKGAALSHVTVRLLREVLDWVRRAATVATECPQATHVVCDKHGARNYYTALLQHHFSEHWIEPVLESHAASRYEWGPPDERVRVTFRMNGEAFLPTALASMTAKYLRELAMHAFNEFWCARVPGLQPTAGYPVDSHRFRKAIAAVQRKLGIDDHSLWRAR